MSDPVWTIAAGAVTVVGSVLSAWLIQRGKASEKSVDTLTLSNTQAFAEMRLTVADLRAEIDELKRRMRECERERLKLVRENAALREREQHWDRGSNDNINCDEVEDEKVVEKHHEK